MLKGWKESWEPFGSCLLNSTANPAKLGWKWAGLAGLFSRQILKGSHDFFPFYILIIIYQLKYETIETHARTFLTLNSLSMGTVHILIRVQQYFGPIVWYRLQRTTSALQVKKKASVFLLSRYKTWERPLGVFLLRNLESSKKCVASFRWALTEFFTPIRTGGVQTDSKGSIQIVC